VAGRHVRTGLRIWRAGELSVEGEAELYIDSTYYEVAELVASYMIPTPVWKSATLIFDQSAQRRSRLGDIDNTTRRGLDQGAARAGFGSADLIH